jgi:hypothetical protein
MWPRYRRNVSDHSECCSMAINTAKRSVCWLCPRSESVSYHFDRGQAHFGHVRRNGAGYLWGVAHRIVDEIVCNTSVEVFVTLRGPLSGYRQNVNCPASRLPVWIAPKATRELWRPTYGFVTRPHSLVSLLPNIEIRILFLRVFPAAAQ